MKIDFHVYIMTKDISENWKKLGGREEYFNLLSKSQ